MEECKSNLMLKNKYKYLQVEREEAIVSLSLDRLPANELNPEFMQELIQVHQDMGEDEEVRALILDSCSPKYFCNGLDPEYMLAQDVPGRREVFVLFFQMIVALYAFPKPHFSVIEGHSMAGGAFLGLVSDFRYMADKPVRYCFSEVAVNFTIPHALLAIIRETIHAHYIRKLAMQAYAFRPQEALDAGLVDFVCPPADIRKTAKKNMLRLLTQPFESLISIKQNLRHPTLDYIEKNSRQALGDIEKLLGKGFEDNMKRLLKRRNSQLL